MSTDIAQNTNRLILETKPIFQYLETVRIEVVQTNTEVDWEHNIVLRCDGDLRSLLLLMKLAQEDSGGRLRIDAKGRAFLGKLLLGLDDELNRQAKAAIPIDGRYILQALLASGKNSLTYRADDRRLGRIVVLKFFRPGRGEGVINNVARLGRINAEPVLVNVLDVFEYKIDDHQKRRVPINVMVFPFIEGITLRAYLANERNDSPAVIQEFIEQAGFALLALENAGLGHGDLHPNNVMVTTEANGRVGFRIIDVSYGSDAPSDYEFPSNDMESFKFILRLAIQDIESRLTRISLRRYLGARTFTLVEYILRSAQLTFRDIDREIITASRFTAFEEHKALFLRSKFKPPRDFGILRYEEFSNPTVALKLFCPYPELFERLCAFGSAILFGHRGTGKSTYMAAMNFFPQADDMPLDYRDSFGVLFSCRQGEFRKFSGRYLKMSADVKLQIKDILIAKIVRKTLNSLAAGVAKGRLSPPQSVTAIADFVLRRLQHSHGLMISHQLSEIESLKSTMLQAEISLIDKLFAHGATEPQSKMLDEHSLIEFFESVRVSFRELNQTRFSVLFDDAGAPNVPKEVQHLMCDLMASTNHVYCIKVSAEKRTFDLVTTDGKPIERVHDVRAYTISDYFSMGGGFSTERKIIETYFRKLVGVRLEVCGFSSKDIRTYLGTEAMKADELVFRLVDNTRGNPVYGGWQIIWQIADRTMRHLLEMISAIFDEAKISPDKPPNRVPYHLQSRQIVRFSKDKLRGLMFLPSTVRINDRTYPVGKRLYEFAASFGKVSGFYLRSSLRTRSRAKRENRFDERLAIEIDNVLNLGPDAERMLDQLIRFAVIDDEKMATALDDGTRKPIYTFNRVYCPILRISFRRDTHWRLSSKRFEQFLLNPTEFVRSDQRMMKFLGSDSDNEFKFPD
jgi:serine/threonine protein kinase